MTVSTTAVTPREVVIKFNGEEFAIKTYLPIAEKIDLITEVLNNAFGEDNYPNYFKSEIYFTLKVVGYYTELRFEDENNIFDNYDFLIHSGLWDKIKDVIPSSELAFLNGCRQRTIEDIYTYNNSAMGILDAIAHRKDDLNVDMKKLEEIKASVSDVKELALLKDVVTKLG